ncbi:hypothetical protein HDU84_009491 [Entophlyctis sp. JEL0112]|nr:hypothetical protein HDU84_009491 [Entophlyctis sp. JEL0112]
MSLADLTETYNPFVATPRVRGQEWILPPLPEIPVHEPGYGCWQNPTSPVGFLLDFTAHGYTDTNVTVPLPVTAENACRPGFFCAYLNVTNNATWPVVCPVNSGCFFLREYGLHCKNPQGLFEPIACPSGYYCPEYNVALPCPAGHYCLTGTVDPIPCEFLSICDLGASVQQHYGILVICAIVDILILVGRTMATNTRFLKYVDRFRTKKVIKPKSDDAESGLPAYPEIRQKISDGFNRILEGRENVKISYEFENLWHTIYGGQSILQGVSGEIQSGKMTAIFGPSGAGKTTFMNVLMGKLGRTDGKLSINESIPEMLNSRKLIGFVPQDNIMIEELTVFENIRYSARTRLPNTWTDKEVDDYVQTILVALNLAHISNQLIGSTLERGISGGQRKRVNIGMELAAAPLAMFLDEPTSGLDSTIAMDVIEILSQVASFGMTIVCAIHQPRVEIFELFDNVLMICAGGATAYFGPVAMAKPYFENLGFVFDGTNDADTLMDILSGRGALRPDIPPVASTVRSILEEWKNHIQMTRPDQVMKTPQMSAGVELNKLAKYRGASFWRQIVLAHNRSIVQQSRLFSAFVMECFVGAVAGALMGISANLGGTEIFTGFYVFPYVTLSSAPRFWLLGMYAMLIGISVAVAATPSGVKVFGEEKVVFIREFEAGHNPTAYFLGKNISVIYRVALSAAHFVGVYFYFAEAPIKPTMIYLLIFLNFFGVYGMGMILSMLLRRENATLVAVVFVLIFEALCGFGPSLTDATNDGYVILLDMGLNRWMAETQFVLWLEPYAQTIDLDLASQSYGYQFGTTTRNLWVMLGLGLGYRFLAYIALMWVLHVGNLSTRWAKTFFVCLIIFVLSVVLLFTVKV